MSVEYLSQAILNQSLEFSDSTLPKSFHLYFRFCFIHVASKHTNFLSKLLSHQNSMLVVSGSSIFGCSRVYFVKDPKDGDGGFSNRKRTNQKKSMLIYIIFDILNRMELFPDTFAMFPMS